MDIKNAGIAIGVNAKTVVTSATTMISSLGIGIGTVWNKMKQKFSSSKFSTKKK